VIGTVLNGTKIIAKLKEGLSGDVYQGTDPSGNAVAVKVLNEAASARPDKRKEFVHGCQAARALKHPNILQVLEVHEGDPFPYCVMELFESENLKVVLWNKRDWIVGQEFFILRQIAAALRTCHDAKIVHGDVRPENILVNARGVAKLTDFSISQSQGSKLFNIFSSKKPGGSPLYMSPEQAGQSGLDIDTRSDIYSLGVLLYELLTGTTPFDKDRFKEAGYDEMRRIIREEEPPKPSTRISTLSQAAATVSANRQSDPKRLTALVRGELDWIVMKALEKDRNRRYETANGLARDIERYLHDEPVQACPPSAWYRFRKFARRNKRAVASVVVVALAVLVAVGGIAGGVGWVARERAARQFVLE